MTELFLDQKKQTTVVTSYNLDELCIGLTFFFINIHTNKHKLFLSYTAIFFFLLNYNNFKNVTIIIAHKCIFLIFSSTGIPIFFIVFKWITTTYYRRILGFFKKSVYVRYHQYTTAQMLLSFS